MTARSTNSLTALTTVLYNVRRARTADIAGPRRSWTMGYQRRCPLLVVLSPPPAVVVVAAVAAIVVIAVLTALHYVPAPPPPSLVVIVIIIVPCT